MMPTQEQHPRGKSTHSRAGCFQQGSPSLPTLPGVTRAAKALKQHGNQLSSERELTLGIQWPMTFLILVTCDTDHLRPVSPEIHYSESLATESWASMEGQEAGPRHWKWGAGLSGSGVLCILFGDLYYKYE